MPKVSEEYLENKRNMILDAAQRVCNQKSAYAVTMKDIIRESGVSQGGIYRFFENLDDVFVSLLNRYYSKSDFQEKIDQIFTLELPPEKVLQRLCRYLTIHMLEMVRDYGKLIYELNMYYANNLDQFRAIKDRLNEQNAYYDLIQRVTDFVKLHIELGNFHPLIDEKALLAFMLASYNGIDEQVTLHYGYGIPPGDNDEWELDNAVMLMETFEKVLLILLGVKPD